MLTGCEKLWKLLIEKNMKNSLFMNKSTKPMMIQGLCFSLCFFAFQLTEFTVNDRAEILFESFLTSINYQSFASFFESVLDLEEVFPELLSSSLSLSLSLTLSPTFLSYSQTV